MANIHRFESLFESVIQSKEYKQHQKDMEIKLVVAGQLLVTLLEVTTPADRVNYLISNPLKPFFRSNHRRCSSKEMFLKISQNSQENTCAGGSFLIKLQAFECLRTEASRFCPVNFVNFLRTSILKNICERLLLFFVALKVAFFEALGRGVFRTQLNI